MMELIKSMEQFPAEIFFFYEIRMELEIDFVVVEATNCF